MPRNPFAAAVFRPAGQVHASFAPTTLRRTLRYSGGIANVTGSGTLTYYALLANGCYDPVVAVGGHQPMGFDQFMAMYNRFTVVASRITAECVIQSVPQVVGIALVKGTSSSYANYTQFIENGSCITRVGAASADLPVKLSLTQVTSRTAAVRDPFDDDSLSGSASADPTQLYTFILFNQDTGLASIATTQFVYAIEYDVVFSQPKELAQS